MAKCPHENLEYVDGHYVAPYGWEAYPGWYCLDCVEMLEDGEPYSTTNDPDLARKYELEDDMRDLL